MFCNHCGTEIPDNSRFCLNCGEPFDVSNGDDYGFASKNNAGNSAHSALSKKQSIFDTSAVLAIVLTLFVLLSMIFLPMFVFSTDTHERYEDYPELNRDYSDQYYVKLVGKNLISGDSAVITEINNACRTCFVFMIAMVSMTLLFTLIKKPWLSLLAGMATLAFFLTYALTIVSKWTDQTQQNEISSTFYSWHWSTEGIACALCIVALCVLSIVGIIKSRTAKD